MSKHLFRWLAMLLSLMTLNIGLAADPVVHRLHSPRQASVTTVRVLLPDIVPNNNEPRLRVVYILPVEAGDGTRWGDAIAEVKKHDLHNKHNVVCVFPTFADLPWYADHPENPQLQQEAYFLQDVLPLVEQQHPVRSDREGRLLVGFSKSGWGAWSLLLRHPDLFHRAAAFDAPMMMDAPGKYGSGPVFGTVENFRKYQITRLLEERAAELRNDPARMMLIGQGNFQAEHQKINELLKSTMTPCSWVAGLVREHSWHSGWMPEVFQWIAM